MTNEEYFEYISNNFAKIDDLRKEYLRISKGIIGETLLKEDLFFCASVDKGIRILDGFIQMLKERNLTCAGALVRMQIDNCLRTYAPFVAENKEEVLATIIYSNKEIRDCKDKNGKKMFDSTLLKWISTFDKAITKVYKQASGYVHLSEKAFYCIARVEDPSLLTLNIGGALDEKCNTAIEEGLAAFVYFTKLHQKILQSVADSKTRYDTHHNVEGL